MNVIQLNSLARQLREVALSASKRDGDSDLSIAHLAVIEAVTRNPNSSVAEITEQTGLAQSWVSKIVAEQTNNGVFAQIKDQKDKRRTLISLSEEARNLTFSDRGLTPIDEALATAFPDLTEDRLDELVRLLDHLQALLEPGER